MRGGKEAFMIREMKKHLDRGDRVTICVANEDERDSIIATYGLPRGVVMVSGQGVSANMSTLPATLEYFDRREI